MSAERVDGEDAFLCFRGSHDLHVGDPLRGLSGAPDASGGPVPDHSGAEDEATVAPLRPRAFVCRVDESGGVA